MKEEKAREEVEEEWRRGLASRRMGVERNGDESRGKATTEKMQTGNGSEGRNKGVTKGGCS